MRKVLEMIHENFVSCPFITAAVLEFSSMAYPLSVIPECCITTTAKTQEAPGKIIVDILDNFGIQVFFESFKEGGQEPI